MSEVQDSVQVTDDIVVDTTPGWFYPCPGCGKGMKPDHDPDNLVCRRCKKVLPKTEIAPAQSDGATPNYPCPECGKETKLHHDGGRICSRRICPARLAKLAG